MYTKTELSKIIQVSEQDINRLEQSGLLTPVSDPVSSMIFYSKEQTARARKILILEELGFPLNTIQELINTISYQDLINLLNKVRYDKDSETQAEFKRLSKIQSHISLLEDWEKILSSNEVTLKSVPEILVVSIRDTVVDLSAVRNIFENIKSILQPYEFIKTGHPILIYHDDEYKEENIDLEVAIPINDVNIPLLPLVNVYRLPALISVASVIHQGNYQTIKITYGKVMVWIERNGFEIIGSGREVFLNSDIDFNNPLNGIEIQIPIEQTLGFGLQPEIA